MRILLVEDDRRVAAAAERYFCAQAGWELDIAPDGVLALQMFDERYGAVLVDWILPEPGPDGLEVCRRIRARSTSVILIFVSARDGADEIVRALESGADEYVVKPFEAKVLQARVVALARRATSSPGDASSADPMIAGDGRGDRSAAVFRYLSLGLANKEIANALGCSVKNIEYHVGRILRKTNCTSRTQLIARARKASSDLRDLPSSKRRAGRAYSPLGSRELFRR